MAESEAMVTATEAAGSHTPMTTQDDWWHLRRLTLWRLGMTIDERVAVNAEAYQWWRFGQENRARVIVEAKAQHDRSG